MARTARRFTAKQVAAMSKPGRYCDGHRLWLQVRDADHKSWLYRYTSPVTLKPRSMGLGDAFAVSLADARQKAEDANKLIRSGKDPLEEEATAKRAKKEAALLAIGKTFKQAAEAYLAAHAAKWSNSKHAKQWPATLETYAYPVIGSLPVREIDKDHVLKILEPLWRTKTVTADRLRGRIETVLSYATTKEWRFGENPARWRGHLANLLPAPSSVAKIEHHAAVAWRECPEFMQGALAAEEGFAAMALRFTILTTARAGEVIGATWKEIDMAAKVWAIPGPRMKGKKEHKVPLSDAAMKILRQAAELGQHPDAPVFRGRKDGQPLAEKALLDVLARLGRGDVTVHGFRSTFRDWAAEATEYPREVAEVALAHVVGSAVERAYRRGDLMQKRIEMMAAWSTFLLGDASR